MSKASPPKPYVPERHEHLHPLTPAEWEALEARAAPGGIYRIVSTSPSTPTVYVILKPRVATASSTTGASPS